jgi:hypothetical protein
MKVSDCLETNPSAGSFEEAVTSGNENGDPPRIYQRRQLAVPIFAAPHPQAMQLVIGQIERCALNVKL